MKDIGDEMNKKLNIGDIKDKRLINILELTVYLGVGRNMARKFSDEIGATRFIGRRVLFDRNVIDDAINKGVNLV